MTAQMPLVTFGPGQIAAVGTVAGQGLVKWRSSSAPGFVPARVGSRGGVGGGWWCSMPLQLGIVTANRDTLSRWGNNVNTPREGIFVCARGMTHEQIKSHQQNLHKPTQSQRSSCWRTTCRNSFLSNSGWLFNWKRKDLIESSQRAALDYAHS